MPAIYEDFRPGPTTRSPAWPTWTPTTCRSAINYPNTFPRFAGQGFAERADKKLALAALQIYNDWMIDEWCGGAGRGRLVPLTLIPLWDPVLAAAEVRRCAAKGSGAIAFTENPAKLGFESLYTGAWDAAVGGAARRRRRWCRCTSARPRRCPPPATRPRWPCPWR